MIFSLLQLLARKDSVLQNVPEVYSTICALKRGCGYVFCSHKVAANFKNMKLIISMCMYIAYKNIKACAAIANYIFYPP